MTAISRDAASLVRATLRGSQITRPQPAEAFHRLFAVEHPDGARVEAVGNAANAGDPEPPQRLVAALGLAGTARPTSTSSARVPFIRTQAPVVIKAGEADDAFLKSIGGQVVKPGQVDDGDAFLKSIGGQVVK